MSLVCIRIDDEDRVSGGGVRYEAEYILYQLELGMYNNSYYS